MKERIVLHICCAPDEAGVIEILQGDFDLYAFFCNPNIQPASEYEKRLEEAEKVARLYKIPFAASPYHPESWIRIINGFEHTPEGGERCRRCFLLRLQQTADFCLQEKLNSFTTVMSISPHKKIESIHWAGEKAAAEKQVNYLKYNFKKNNNFQKSILLSKKLGLYRQDFCGCRLSKAERDLRIKNRKNQGN